MGGKLGVCEYMCIHVCMCMGERERVIVSMCVGERVIVSMCVG